ncbi:hypothetical protein CUMW_138770 [Citrus unshiu]|uniref:Uncharacterized protein n=1 Tax=Citrus unshiu TaxID=55188 RepID=A0A2H5PI33_CITUN|nr:hypothetical protein CUMW_138770 [Citrus unshiu]
MMIPMIAYWHLTIGSRKSTVKQTQSDKLDLTILISFAVPFGGHFLALDEIPQVLAKGSNSVVQLSFLETGTT